MTTTNTTERWLIYAETHTNGTITRTWVRSYDDRNTANEVALEMGSGWPTYYCVCPLSEAEAMGVQV